MPRFFGLFGIWYVVQWITDAAFSTSTTARQEAFEHLSAAEANFKEHLGEITRDFWTTAEKTWSNASYPNPVDEIEFRLCIQDYLEALTFNMLLGPLLKKADPEAFVQKHKQLRALESQIQSKGLNLALIKSRAWDCIERV